MNDRSQTRHLREEPKEIGMTRSEQPSRWFRVQPIGYVRRPDVPEPDPEAFYDPWAETALEIMPRWEDALAGIDAWPGTPILDIKGYAPRDDLRQDATVPDWLETLWSAHDAERG